MGVIDRVGIGSEFYLSPSHFFWKKKEFKEHLPKGKLCFVESGRGALTAAIDILCLGKGDEVLLPDYICSEATTPFNKTKTKSYKVKDNFEADIENIRKSVTKKTKAVLVVHYFGFIQPRIKELKKLCDEKEIYLIEDCAQALFTEHAGSRGDVSITSFRKFLPIVDGATISINNENLAKKIKYNKSIKKCAYNFFRHSALLLKWLRTKIPFPEYFNKKYFLLSDSLLERIQKPDKISCISRFMLERFDYDEIIKKRRENYNFLLKNLKTEKIKPIITKLPEGVCPLAFPISCEQKEELKSYLVKNRIYPATYWKNSREILALPIDQRYGEKEMEQVVKKCKRF